MAKIAVIGAGFSGLSAAAYLSREGHSVQVFEKNAEVGGRARQLRTENGFVFDMGPSWYWMPEVFERFFNDFGRSASDFYELKLLDPNFEMVFKDREVFSVPAGMEELEQRFESVEKGSAARLRRFMDDAGRKYEKAMDKMVYMPGNSWLEFADPGLIRDALRLNILSSFSKHVRRYFSDPKLVALMEFPVLFLGAMPQDTPALYSLMNYAGLKLGTWYPIGGFGKVVEAMASVAAEQGAAIHCSAPVEEIVVRDGKAKGLISGGKEMEFDAIVASADYHHVENRLLPEKYRNYTEAYWGKRTFAPSGLLYYLGIDKPIKSLSHHTLFFEEDLFAHSVEIYKKPAWPSRPLFYVSNPSKTDPGVAPEGHENLCLLIPIAPGLNDLEEQREKYLEIMIRRLEKHTGEKDLASHITYKKSYSIDNFVSDYNAYKGNAYGLANTLMQTAVLKPKMKNKKVKNLFYAGQLTVPGPGVPPALISGNIAANQVIDYIKSK